MLVFDTPAQVRIRCPSPCYSDLSARSAWKGYVHVSGKHDVDLIGRFSQPTSGTGHPTVNGFEQASQVLNRIQSQFRYPGTNEGYEKILYLEPSDHPSPHWSPDEVAVVLSRLEKSSPRGQATSNRVPLVKADG